MKKVAIALALATVFGSGSVNGQLAHAEYAPDVETTLQAMELVKDQCAELAEHITDFTFSIPKDEIYLALDDIRHLRNEGADLQRTAFDAYDRGAPRDLVRDLVRDTCTLNMFEEMRNGMIGKDF